ncbi:OmpA family protein [Marinilabilia rubra]|uniref:Flagellar motor protein MotB n=1 Tax=Marinilabilia rubra TaxID=2162893 RepID=A0A2U2B9Y0_9BACT|nr:OmpA family protein [Marinilabilia rubra]PWD99854.1 flagellar motor protein MotB [Marinilabilia rubra]
MKFFILTVLLLLSASLTGQKREKDSVFVKTPEMIFSFGQTYNSWSVSGGFGPVFIYADQSDYRLIPNQKIDLGPSVWVTKHLVPAFAFELQYLQSEMYGQEGRYGFEGDFLDVSINGIAVINQMSARPGPLKDRWNYYLKIGVGASLFRSKLINYETGEVARRNEVYDTPNDDYVVLGYDETNPNKKTAREADLVLPFGLGVMYRINNSFDIGLESMLRFSAADRLDNILTGATNDRYLYTAFNVSYKFGDKDQRHMRWTYRAEGMDMFGRKQENRLQDEVRQLEDDIAEYEKNRPVHKDSVVITETLRVVYDRYDVKTIFFPPGASRRFSPDDELLMGRVAIELLNDSSKTLSLYGYSDSSGSAETNLELSRQRCESVKEFFVSDLDISPHRISIYPRGEDNPLSPLEELSPRGLSMVNRRVDLVVD